MKTGVIMDEDWWNLMPDDIKAQLEIAIQQADNGEVISHEEMKIRFAEWFSQ